MGIGGFDGELAAVGHRVARVDGDVDDGILELLRIGMDRPQAGCGDHLDMDGLAQRRVQQIRHVADHLVGIEPARRQRLLPREGEQALRQRGRTLGGGNGGVEEPSDIEIALLHAA